MNLILEIDEALVLYRDESSNSIEERLRSPMRRDLCVSKRPIQAYRVRRPKFFCSSYEKKLDGPSKRRRDDFLRQ